MIEHAVHLVETGLLYALIGAGFYLLSIATRHVAFAGALAFLLAPLGGVWVSNGPELGFGGLAAGVGACGFLGWGYSRWSTLLSRNGAREGQLLVVSLAVMAIGENAIVSLVGGASIGLWPYQGMALVEAHGSMVTPQQATVILGGGFVLLLVAAVWRWRLWGAACRALSESPRNVSLLGIPTQLVESGAAILGAVLIGLAGTGWAITARVRPTMLTNIAVIGAFSQLAGTLAGRGLGAVIGACFALACVRLALTILFEGDWAMSAMLVVTLAALLKGALGVRAPRMLS